MPTATKSPPPVPGSTALRIARHLAGMSKSALPPDRLDNAASKLAGAIQVGIDYEVAKVSAKAVKLELECLKYRTALEKIVVADTGCREIAKEALE